MKASETIIKRIKEFEGFSAKPYRDSAGVLTIGYGTTKDADKYASISKIQADLLLRRDLAQFEATLNNYIAARGYELTQNQFDALVSFLYNVGSIKSGSNLDASIRQGKPKVVAANLERYVYAGGQKLPGLVKRRKYEAYLFSTNPTDIIGAILAGVGLFQF
jgi:lysozyme